MWRALIELLFTIFVIVMARALLTSVIKNFTKASLGAFQNRSAPKAAEPAGPSAGGELHRDPVCGTFVAEASAIRRQVAGRTLFYCSEDCRKKDALAH
jgi:hypothetical protein